MRQRKPSKAKIAQYWRDFYDSQEGRAAVGAMMARAGVYSTLAVTDPVQAGIAIGERNMAVWLAEIIGFRGEEFVEDRDKIDRVDLLAQFNYQT